MDLLKLLFIVTIVLLNCQKVVKSKDSDFFATLLLSNTVIDKTETENFASTEEPSSSCVMGNNALSEKTLNLIGNASEFVTVTNQRDTSTEIGIKSITSNQSKLFVLSIDNDYISSIDIVSKQQTLFTLNTINPNAEVLLTNEFLYLSDVGPSGRSLYKYSATDSNSKITVLEETNMYGITSDCEYVYILGDENVTKIGISSNKEEPIINSNLIETTSSHAITVDNKNLYVYDSGDISIKKFDKSNGTFIESLSTINGVRGLLVDSSNIYMVVSNFQTTGDAVVKISKSGKNQTPIIVYQSPSLLGYFWTEDISSDGTSIYITQGNNGGKVIKIE